MGRSYLLLGAAILATTTAIAQPKSDKKIVKQLKTDIGYLASDALQGRRTGSAGEKAASDYIINYYKQQGVAAYKGKYLYPFTFINGKAIAKSTVLKVNNTAVKPEDGFALPFSADGNINSAATPDIMEQGGVWMMPLYDNEDQANDAHFDWEKKANEMAREAAKRGAIGAVIYDQYGAKFTQEFNKRSDYETIDIPAAFLTYSGYQAYLQNGEEVQLDMNITIKKTELVGHNIASYVDNGAKYTVVLGAHYDHLGMGQDGNSRYTGGAAIHNGADDNASGTAALMQLATWVSSNKDMKAYNYLFLHFSAEELGLIGSKAFVKDMGLDSNTIAYMINMDMIGRLNDSTHSLTIGGIGTSKTLASTVNSYGSAAQFKLALDSSGVGPSDHSSFYYQGIPVLFFFTGTHTDYHKPSDDADKINYEGEAMVMRYIYDVVSKMENFPKPQFTPTKQQSIGKVRFKVTLGIMPDYAFQGEGVRVDGVSDNRPAMNAGVQGGDIITKLGDVDIKGMQSYMEALGEFEEGDKTTIIIKRGDQELSFPLEFTPKDDKKHQH